MCSIVNYLDMDFIYKYIEIYCNNYIMIGIFNFIDMLIISTIPQLNTYVASYWFIIFLQKH